MFYTIYKTINLINGKYYYGKHQTTNPDDNYLGSGKLIASAIQKYGAENFSKQVLFVFETEEEMNRKEIDLITSEVINDPQSYNVGVGGEGGPHFAGRKHTEETKQKLREARKNAPLISEVTRQKLRDNNWARQNPEGFRAHAVANGKKVSHTQETKDRISQSLTKYHSENILKPRVFQDTKVTCPHCGKQGAPSPMARWHFGNCKTISDRMYIKKGTSVCINGEIFHSFTSAALKLGVSRETVRQRTYSMDYPEYILLNTECNE